MKFRTLRLTVLSLAMLSFLLIGQPANAEDIFSATLTAGTGISTYQVVTDQAHIANGIKGRRVYAVGFGADRSSVPEPRCQVSSTFGSLKFEGWMSGDPNKNFGGQYWGTEERTSFTYRGITYNILELVHYNSH